MSQYSCKALAFVYIGHRHINGPFDAVLLHPAGIECGLVTYSRSLDL